MSKYITHSTEEKYKRFSQKWNPKEFFVMKGKRIIIKDYVQENAEGTDFYENLEKFGNLETTIEFMSKNRAEINENFEKALSLKDIEDRRIQILEIWNTLPPKLRDIFNNDFSNFMTNGANYFDTQEKIFQEQIKNERQRQTQYTNKQQVQKAEQPETPAQKS